MCYLQACKSFILHSLLPMYHSCGEGSCSLQLSARVSTMCMCTFSMHSFFSYAPFLLRCRFPSCSRRDHYFRLSTCIDHHVPPTCRSTVHRIHTTYLALSPRSSPTPPILPSLPNPSHPARPVPHPPKLSIPRQTRYTQINNQQPYASSTLNSNKHATPKCIYLFTNSNVVKMYSGCKSTFCATGGFG